MISHAHVSSAIIYSHPWPTLIEHLLHVTMNHVNK